MYFAIHHRLKLYDIKMRQPSTLHPGIHSIGFFSQSKEPRIKVKGQLSCSFILCKPKKGGLKKDSPPPCQLALMLHA